MRLDHLLSKSRNRTVDHKYIGPIAQSVEHRADNAGVSGSIPLGPISQLKFNWIDI